MTGLLRKIEKVMDEIPGGRFSAAAACLGVFSLCYGAGVRILDRLWRRKVFLAQKLPCPVISIGNLCVGGTGKTPMTLFTAKMLQQTGLRICVLSRGYKGEKEKSGGIVTDGDTLFMDVKSAGDEAYMMARDLIGVPVLVGKDRCKSGWKAIAAFAPDVLILDDGFQHRKLHRDIDIVLLDHQRPFGNYRLLPAGRLREPLSALSRAHVVVLTRSESKNRIDSAVKAWAAAGNRPVFHASHRPFPVKRIAASGAPVHLSADQQICPTDVLKGKTVFGFSGIAHNDQFRNTIENLGGRVAGFASFSDHHPYTQNDLQHIAASASLVRAELIATTQKDDVRISSAMVWPADYVVIGMEIYLADDQAAYKAFVLDRIAAAKKRSSAR